MTIIKCGKCGKISEAEEVTIFVYYRCVNCKSLNEIFDVPLKSWLGFNYNEYLLSINQFLKQNNFENLLAQSNIELKAGRLSSTQINKLRGVLSSGFANELSLKQIADNIEKQVKPKDLFRMKNGKIVIGKNGKPSLALSAIRRPISLARTETTRAGAEGSLLHYKDGKVEKVRFTASFGARTCPTCESLNGQIFTLEESGGVIPVHGYCRCTWIPITEIQQSISHLTNFRSYQND